MYFHIILGFRMGFGMLSCGFFMSESFCLQMRNYACFYVCVLACVCVCMRVYVGVMICFFFK